MYEPPNPDNLFKGAVEIPPICIVVLSKLECVCNFLHTVRNKMMRGIIEEESLTQEEIRKLSPLPSQYVMPYNQAQTALNGNALQMLHDEVAEINTRRQSQTSRYGFIFYNTDQRENGAEEEASNLQQALSETGCDVIKAKWEHTHQLQEMISDRLSDIGGRCNFLFACIMSHGELGQLRGSDESLVSISTVIKLFEQNLPSHVPLVSDYMQMELCPPNKRADN